MFFNLEVKRWVICNWVLLIHVCSFKEAPLSFETARKLGTSIARDFKSTWSQRKKSRTKMPSLFHNIVRLKFTKLLEARNASVFRISASGKHLPQRYVKTCPESPLSTEHRLRLFRAMVEPVLLYGCETWTVNQEMLDRLNGCYTRLLRIAHNVDRTAHARNSFL